MAIATPATAEQTPELPESKPRRGFKKQPTKNPPPEAGAIKPFWERVCDLTNEDWQRSELFIYLLEPIADLVKLTGKKYYKKYTGGDDAPRSDADILKELGSGKYRIMLNRRKPGADKSDMVDLHEFTEFNMNMPPKLPRKFWLKDPRNERWESMLPEEPAQAQQAGAAGTQPSFVETARLLQEIRRDAREEALEAQPIVPEPPDPVEQMKGVASILKEMRGETPKDSGTAELLRIMDASAARLHSDLQAARQREHELQMRLLEAMKPQPAQESEITKKIVDKFLEESIDGKGKEAEAPERRGRVTGMDILHDVAVALPNSPVMSKLSDAFYLWMQGNLIERQMKMRQANPQPAANARPQQSPALNPPGIPEPQPQQQEPQPEPQQEPEPIMNFSAEQIAKFVPQIIQPLCNAIEQGQDGYALAETFRMMFGAMPFEMLKNQGKEKIFAAIQMSQFWRPFQINGQPHPGLAQLEPQLKNMIEEFCMWPPADDEDEDDGEDNGDLQPEVL